MHNWCINCAPGGCTWQASADAARSESGSARSPYYFHHGSWWVYYLDGERQVRRRTGPDEEAAAVIAAQVNAQLATAAPTMFSFQPLAVPELCQQFLDHHEHVLRSSVATIRRYRTALRHLENFAARNRGPVQAQDIDADRFIRYLRSIDVAPNGHKNSARRKLRDKGVLFILEICRNLYTYAAKKRHLPPYTENPFTTLAGSRFQIEDAKRIFVFGADTELAMFKAAGAWDFPIFFTLAKTGIRPGRVDPPARRGSRPRRRLDAHPRQAGLGLADQDPP